MQAPADATDPASLGESRCCKASVRHPEEGRFETRARHYRQRGQAKHWTCVHCMPAEEKRRSAYQYGASTLAP